MMLEPNSDSRSNAQLEQWFLEARAGSNEALGNLLELCRPYLLSIANAELPLDLRAKGGPSDLVQQSFLKAQQGFGGFEGDNEEALLAWLRRILINDLANFRRHYRDTHKRQVGRERSIEYGSSMQSPGDEVAADAASPSSLLGQQEDEEELARALTRLPDDYQRVISLRYWNRLSFGDIGKLMDRTPNAVRKLWLRAIERLHDEMQID